MVLLRLFAVTLREFMYRHASECYKWQNKICEINRKSHRPSEVDLRSQEITIHGNYRCIAYATETVKKEREFRIAERCKPTEKVREGRNNENLIVQSRHRDWNGADGRCKKRTVALIFILRTSSFVLSTPRLFSSRWPTRSSRDENFCQGRKPYFFFSVTYRVFEYRATR